MLANHRAKERETKANVIYCSIENRSSIQCTKGIVFFRSGAASVGVYNVQLRYLTDNLQSHLYQFLLLCSASFHSSNGWRYRSLIEALGWNNA